MLQNFQPIKSKKEIGEFKHLNNLRIIYIPLIITCFTQIFADTNNPHL